MIWHIMKNYSHFKVNKFIILAGYKSEVLKSFFLNYHYYRSSFSIDLKNNKIRILKNDNKKMKIGILLYLIQEKRNVGGRIKKAEQII